MIVDHDGEEDIRCFDTNCGYRHSRISAHRLQEMRPLDIRAAGPRWRNGWLVRLAQTACIQKPDDSMIVAGPETALLPPNSRIQPSVRACCQELGILEDAYPS